MPTLPGLAATSHDELLLERAIFERGFGERRLREAQQKTEDRSENPHASPCPAIGRSLFRAPNR